MATSKLPIKRTLAENLTTFPLCLHPFYDPLRSGRRSPPSANLCGPLTRNRLCQRFCHPGLLQSLPTARASLDLFTMLVPSHKLILFATHPSGQVPVPIYLHVPLHTSLCDRFAEYFSSVAPPIPGAWVSIQVCLPMAVPPVPGMSYGLSKYRLSK